MNTMQEVQDVTQEALDIIDALDKANIKATLCGGCARDLAHGIVPKDYDIVVHENQSSEVLAQRLTEAGFYAIEAYGDTCSTREDVRDDLDCVMSACAPNGAKCDILIYTCDFDSPEEIIRTFDCTLNMAWLGREFDGLTIQTCDDYPSQSLPIRANKFVEGVDETRIRYIAGKFPQYQHIRS